MDGEPAQHVAHSPLVAFLRLIQQAFALVLLERPTPPLNMNGSARHLSSFSLDQRCIRCDPNNIGWIASLREGP